MRITSGKNKGGKLFSPVLASVRPTKNIVKAALFNFMRPYIKDSFFLDLFSGSGAIGIQALCEGSKSVCFVEKNSHCIDVIIKNLQKIKLTDKATIVKSRVETFIRHHDLSFFDFIFMDPPYFYTIAQYCTLIEEILKKIKLEATIFFEYPTIYDLGFLSLANNLQFISHSYGNTSLGSISFKK